MCEGPKLSKRFSATFHSEGSLSLFVIDKNLRDSIVRLRRSKNFLVQWFHYWRELDKQRKQGMIRNDPFRNCYLDSTTHTNTIITCSYLPFWNLIMNFDILSVSTYQLHVLTNAFPLLTLGNFESPFAFLLPFQHVPSFRPISKICRLIIVHWVIPKVTKMQVGLS